MGPVVSQFVWHTSPKVADIGIIRQPGIPLEDEKFDSISSVRKNSQGRPITVLIVSDPADTSYAHRPGRNVPKPPRWLPFWQQQQQLRRSTMTRKLNEAPALTRRRKESKMVIIADKAANEGTKAQRHHMGVVDSHSSLFSILLLTHRR